MRQIILLNIKPNPKEKRGPAKAECNAGRTAIPPDGVRFEFLLLFVESSTLQARRAIDYKSIDGRPLDNGQAAIECTIERTVCSVRTVDLHVIKFYLFFSL